MSNSRSYHHGNLRAELIAAALDVTRQHGHEAVSLRALAEELGVSRGAPYRHFPDREALLAEVALHGFQTLEDLLQATRARKQPPADKLRVAARLFLDFVRTDPRMFRAMYEAELLTGGDIHPRLAESQRATYEGLDHLLEQALPEAGPRARRLRLITLWSALYGFAKIRQTNLLQPYMQGGLTEEEIESAVVEAAIGTLPDQA